MSCRLPRVSRLQLSECIRRGVSLLVRDSGGCSALHIAAQKGHAELVSFILQQGKTGDIRSSVAVTPDPDVCVAVGGVNVLPVRECSNTKGCFSFHILFV